MPEVAKIYSITELEMCRLAMDIATFSHLLKKVDFNAVVDHKQNLVASKYQKYMAETKV